MSVESPEALERSVLESKDREQLLAIAAAIGVKATSRAKKAEIIDKILTQTGHHDQSSQATGTTSESPRPRANGRAKAVKVVDSAETVTEAPAADAETPLAEAPAIVTVTDARPDAGPDTEPPAEWELTVEVDGEQSIDVDDDEDDDDEDGPGDLAVQDAPAFEEPGVPGSGQPDPFGESRSARRRRRRKNRDRHGEGPQGTDRNDRPERTDRPEPSPRVDRVDRVERPERAERFESVSGQEQLAAGEEPVEIEGYLDLRDEGYGFVRVSGYLPSRDDVYVSVKQTRQLGLRKGDHITGLSRAAARNEKNPALLRIDTVNGEDPERARQRPRFEDLTPLFPDEKLSLESASDPQNMTARIIDLVAPIGKGQRGLIVSPPKAGKTFVMKTIATSIERNNPEVKLMVLLVDERPEEVTDMRRTVKGEVIASTFDRPSDEHTHVSELCIERAKRLVEMGADVVVILDGITRLARAYNLAAPATGRIMSGGIDAGALYPPKKFFGAARNIEEGGSLTILATALVETNSRMDDAIFEEFKGTGNMELRLDRKLAERRIYPAIDVDASSTRHEELLFDRKQLQMVWKLRRVLSGLAAEGSAAPGLELLIDRLKTFRTNDEFLGEIAKQPAF
jgi:transcription termination factor Rho